MVGGQVVFDPGTAIPSKRAHESSEESDSDNSRRYPKRTRMRNNNTRRNVAKNDGSQITDENRFNGLKDDDNGEVMEPFPPIVIAAELKNPRDTYAKIKSWAQNIHFRTTMRGKKQIITYNKVDYDMIKKRLDECAIEYYTYTPKADKVKHMVLKGIDPSYTVEEICDDLMKQSEAIVDVVQMKCKKPGENLGKPLNIYLVTIKFGTSISDLKKSVRYCCDHKIVLEPYSKPPVLRGTQCFRCQRYGHAAKNCSMKYCCVKCADSHTPGVCPKRKDDKPKCANCNGDYTANYRGCSAAKNYRTLITDNRSTSTNTKTSQRLSYAAVLHNKQQPAQQQIQLKQHKHSHASPVGQKSSSQLFEQFNTEVNVLFAKNLSQVIIKIKEFWKSHKKLTDLNLRQQSMINFLVSIVSCDDD